MTNFSREPETSSGGTQQSAEFGDEVWGRTYPKLDKALSHYDGVDALPSDSWLEESQADRYQVIDPIIDAVIVIIESSAAKKCREQIRLTVADMESCRKKQAECRDLEIAAPAKSTLAFPKSIWTTSREAYKQKLKELEREEQRLHSQIATLRVEFCSSLRLIGIQVNVRDVDCLLMPIVSDDVVSMSAVVSNIRAITIQLEKSTAAAKESPTQTRRYYGMYLLLVYALERLQSRFIHEIETVHLPKIDQFEGNARQNIDHASSLISNGGSSEVLLANIEAGKTTIRACEYLAEILRERRSIIAAENEKTKLMLATAKNTYNTVRTSIGVADLISGCQKAFSTLQQLQLPTLRPFENLQLKAELERLSNEMALHR